MSAESIAALYPAELDQWQSDKRYHRVPDGESCQDLLERLFLDYVAGQKPEDSYVKKLDKAIQEAKMNREWRHEYMTLLMRDQENIEKGMEIGTARGIIETGIDFGLSEEELLRRLQDKLNITIESAKEYLEKFGKQTV